MSPWTTGRDEVEELIESGALQRVKGADQNTQALMVRADEQLVSAGLLVGGSGDGVCGGLRRGPSRHITTVATPTGR